MSTVTTTRDSMRFLPQIKALWRKNSSTLGFFPDGAFVDHANENRIIVALESKTVVGYLLFRIASGRVSIVHLCVCEEFRSRGIAKLLFHDLSAISSPYAGITLKCRRDFKASKLWPQLGFTASGDVIGRSAEQHLLTVWKRDNGHPDLFTEQIETLLCEKICVVIDANIFYGLLSKADKEDDESKIMAADWLPDSVSLFVTDELLNEINRNENPSERDAHRKYLAQFSSVPTDITQFDHTFSELVQITSIPRTPNHDSDMRHLCKSICGGMKYFVTRDERVLRYSDAIFEKFNILILRPSDFIIHLDEMMNKSSYEPFRLSGTRFQIRPLKSGEQDRAASTFLTHENHERKCDLLSKIHAVISNGNAGKCYVCSTSQDNYEFFIAYHEQSDDLLNIPIIRVAQSKLSKTIARHLVLQIKSEADQRGKCLVKISDNCLSNEMRTILLEEGFHTEKEGLYKAVIRKFEDSSRLQSSIKSIHSKYPNLEFLPKISDAIKHSTELRSVENLIRCEKEIWPGKIRETNIPTYVIPIKPYYAQELFDVGIANSDLFGSSDLILNRELVYYRSARPQVLAHPARILWYVSMDKRFTESGQIRACSYLIDIQLGTPKILFRKYRRLGVYKWSDLVKVSNDKLDEKIMAVKFSDTELAKRPIDWNMLQSILSEEGAANNLQSPVKISNTIFGKLYTRGFIDE